MLSSYGRTILYSRLAIIAAPRWTCFLWYSKFGKQNTSLKKLLTCSVTKAVHVLTAEILLASPTVTLCGSCVTHFFRGSSEFFSLLTESELMTC